MFRRILAAALLILLAIALVLAGLCATVSALVSLGRVRFETAE